MTPQGQYRTRQFANVLDDIASPIASMITIQMEAYPSDWSDADKREMAMRHLFGRPGSAIILGSKPNG